MKQKIVHLCLYGPVMDEWDYQDNLLAKYHGRLGYDVTIITSKWIWNENNELEYYDRSHYKNNDNITIIRLDTCIGKNVLSKIKIYKNLYKELEQEKPDILFIHDADYLDIIKVKKYLKNNINVKLFVDNHNDFSNSGKMWLSREILHKILWRYTNRMLLPFAEIYYGVLPARVDFLVDIYKIPKYKTGLLMMGADDDAIKYVEDSSVAKRIRERWGIRDSDFLIVTGGKIDRYKTQTVLLMKAVKDICCDNIKLIVFGSVDRELKHEVLELCDDRIQYVGWAKGLQSYEFFSASDLVAFPGRHSVYWEEVAGIGKPMLCKYWEGTTHIDFGGNVEFLYEDSEAELISKLLAIISDKKKYEEMKENAERVKKLFLYSEIAEKSIAFSQK